MTDTLNPDALGDLHSALTAIVARYAPTMPPANDAVSAMWQDAFKAIAKAECVEPPKPLRWEVTNRRTGKVTTYKTGAAASRAADRMDNAHGSYICTRRAVWS